MSGTKGAPNNKPTKADLLDELQKRLNEERQVPTGPNIDELLQRFGQPELVDLVNQLTLTKLRWMVVSTDDGFDYIAVGRIRRPRLRKRHAIGGSLISLTGLLIHAVYTHMDTIISFIGTAATHASR